MDGLKNIRDLIEKAKNEGFDAFGFATNPTLNRVSILCAEKETWKDLSVEKLASWIGVLAATSHNPNVAGDLNLFLTTQAFKILILCDLLDIEARKRFVPIVAQYTHLLRKDLSDHVLFIFKIRAEEMLKSFKSTLRGLEIVNPLDESQEEAKYCLIAGLLDIDRDEAKRIFSSSPLLKIKEEK